MHTFSRVNVAIVAAALITFSAALAAKPFHFVALGDTAYNLPGDTPVYEKLIDRINAAKPAFTIHVGDTWGALPCTRENHEWIRGEFGRYDHPVVYTPGDNEWTDCRKPEVLAAYVKIVTGTAGDEDRMLIGRARQFDNAFAGTSYADTLESLATIRDVFFSKPLSQGAKTMPLVRQADVSDEKQAVENSRWTRDDVLFATVHVPGSAMNFTVNDAVRANEAIVRNRAAVAWIKATFAEADRMKASAVVLALHASLFGDGDGGDFSNRELRGGEEGPYFWIALAIRDFGDRFGKPVLLINGDFHDLVIDRPFMVSQGENKPPKYANITRLQVYGAPELKAVQVGVDTKTPWVFSFNPLY